MKVQFSLNKLAKLTPALLRLPWPARQEGLGLIHCACVNYMRNFWIGGTPKNFSSTVGTRVGDLPEIYRTLFVVFARYTDLCMYGMYAYKVCAPSLSLSCI